MDITTIEQLKQRIGKYVVLSKTDPTYKRNTTLIKLITKIEQIDKRYFKVPKTIEINPIFFCKIWGKHTAYKTTPFTPTAASLQTETFSSGVQYARDPTEEEIKTFKKMWRNHLYHKKRQIIPI